MNPDKVFKWLSTVRGARLSLACLSKAGVTPKRCSRKSGNATGRASHTPIFILVWCHELGQHVQAARRPTNASLLGFTLLVASARSDLCQVYTEQRAAPAAQRRIKRSDDCKCPYAAPDSWQAWHGSLERIVQVCAGAQRESAYVIYTARSPTCKVSDIGKLKPPLDSRIAAIYTDPRASICERKLIGRSSLI